MGRSLVLVVDAYLARTTSNSLVDATAASRAACCQRQATIAIFVKRVVEGNFPDGRPKFRRHHLHLQMVPRILVPSKHNLLLQFIV